MNVSCLRRIAPALVCCLLAACDPISGVRKTLFGGGEPSAPPRLAGFIGGVAGDEPRAVLAARDILATGGDAADAAVTLGFMLSATLPSRASLGAGGACLAYQPKSGSPNKGVPEAILFTSAAPRTGGGDRPAAVPMLARGLYLLSARYGSKPFGELLAPAEEAARFGIPVSRALATDLAVVARPLAADPEAARLFAPGGTPLAEGAPLVQPALGATLSQIRTVGVGDMYQGLLAHKIAEASAAAGGPVSVEDLRLARPALADALSVPAGNDQAAFLPPPADGGLAAAAAFVALRQGASPQAAAARGNGAAGTWRTGGGNPGALIGAGGGGTLPALPASTSFVTVDRMGGAVACALSLNNLFGTGRIAPGTGILLAASPGAKPPPLLAAAIIWNRNIRAFRAAVGASGQEAAGISLAEATDQLLHGAAPAAVTTTEPGRINAASCDRYLPGAPDRCRFGSDPRGSGLARGGE